jgi:hypothetical protein
MPSSGRGGAVSVAATRDLARKALEGHAWQEASERFAWLADRQDVTGEDLEALGEAAWWSAHPQQSIDAFTRAWAAYEAEGSPRKAGYASAPRSSGCAASSPKPRTRRGVRSPSSPPSVDCRFGRAVERGDVGGSSPLLRPHRSPDRRRRVGRSHAKREEPTHPAPLSSIQPDIVVRARRTPRSSRPRSPLRRPWLRRRSWSPSRADLR